MITSKKYLVPFILITTLFFLWGIAHNLNPFLIPHLKKACQLSHLQSVIIDSAFYIVYFIMALPAGMVIKKYGYQSGIVLGLLLFASGALLFYPAAELRVFWFFFMALFVLASGLTFLETAANPYVTALGDKKNATIRLNFSQSFNGLASTIAPILGSTFILSGKNLPSNDKVITEEDAKLFLANEAFKVQVPYLIIGIIVLFVAFIIWKVKLPEIVEVGLNPHSITESIFKQKNLMFGIAAQFFYVGAQVCISTFFIKFVGDVASIEGSNAALYLSIALLAFMVGRFVGLFLMRYFNPRSLLAWYSFFNIILLFIAVYAGNMVSIYALIAVEFFMSIMFPTIFSLSIEDLGAQKKLGSSLQIMAIIGGAVIPIIMANVSDMTNVQTAYLVPAACFFVVMLFAASSKLNSNFKPQISTTI
jgi:FHS family L-fucose permease-like MFS transporter